ncbi:hypothetical protein CL659_04500 [bacterium]|nr:hypothetical protein [bacterium]|tara:strand:+ start:15470 stop:16252 length:783 start_codon:yes stop_codon:yes gene_type:complete
MKTSLIGFGNRYPLTLALERNKIEHDFEFFTKRPVEVEKDWKKEKFETGLLSAGAIISNSKAIPLRSWGISSSGPVMSVGIFSDRPWKELKECRIRDLSSGVTSPLLLKAIWKEKFKHYPKLIHADDPRSSEAVLCIGDKALRWYQDGKYAFFEDLGLVWHEMTGTSIPYAFWCVKKGSKAEKYKNEIDKKLFCSYTWGKKNIDKIKESIMISSGVNKKTAKQYLECYEVKLEKKILQGWNIFKELTRPIISKERYDSKK